LLTITVLEIRGGSVKLDFTAAADVPVHRWEVWEKMGAAGRPADLAGIPPAAPVNRFAGWARPCRGDSSTAQPPSGVKR
jgi:hypothetical protein